MNYDVVFFSYKTKITGIGRITTCKQALINSKAKTSYKSSKYKHDECRLKIILNYENIRANV